MFRFSVLAFAAFSLGVFLIGCETTRGQGSGDSTAAEAAKAASPETETPSVSAEQVDAYLSEAESQFEAKMEKLIADFRLGSYSSYWYDQDLGTLEFRDKDGKPKVRATVVPIGTFALKSNTWLWGWANKSTPEPLRTRAEAVQQLASVLDSEVFKTRGFRGNQEMASQFWALGVRILDAQGGYKFEQDGLWVYLAMTTVEAVP